MKWRRNSKIIERADQVYREAERLFDKGVDWVTFFREILGVDGVARRTFRLNEDLREFERTKQFVAIQEMLVKLRAAKLDEEPEPTRVITVRMPRSMHDYLRSEAHDLRTSMNKLCISKLLQVIEENMIPYGPSDVTPRSYRIEEEPQSAAT
jgi:hypothetical protein